MFIKDNQGNLINLDFVSSIEVTKEKENYCIKLTGKEIQDKIVLVSQNTTLITETRNKIERALDREGKLLNV